MDFLDLCKKRYSVRSYTMEPVSEKQLEYILQCARFAPSAVNLQPWKFLIARSESSRKAVQACYKRDWIAQAPMYIICIICHDEEWVRRDGKRHGDIDIAIAAEHICMAATDQGLGSCWVCNFDAKQLHDDLQLNANEEVAVVIPLGHATEGDIPVKKRKAETEIIEFI